MSDATTADDVRAGHNGLSDNEFEDVVQAATSSGRPVPKLRRKWVNAGVDGSHVSGVAWGKGSPELVLLHGSGESARRFDRLGLVSTRPLVAIDLPGHGQSSWRRDGRYQPHHLANSVAAAIRSFAPGAGAVVGTGLGGLVAVAVAARHPFQVRRLVLVDTWPSVDPGLAWPADVPDSFGTREELLSVAPRLSERNGRFEAVVRSEFAHGSRQRNDGRWVLRHDPRAADPGWGDREAEALWADLRGLSLPELVIFSARFRDQAFKPGEPRTTAPDAQVIELGGTGQDIFDDWAVELLTAIEQFTGTHDDLS